MVEVGEEFPVKFSFDNPLKRPLTGGFLTIEAPVFMESQKLPLP